MSKKNIAYIVIVFFLSFFFSLNVFAYEQGSIVGSSVFSDIAEKNKLAVVNISTVTKAKRIPRQFNQRGFQQGDPFNDLFNDFFERFYGIPQRSMPKQSLGTGFIIDSKGYIITNNHVVENADEISVSLSDEREYKAKLVGTDPKTDIALIRIITKDKLPFVKLGDSEKLKVGEWVMAIGNPFGLNNTVTVGVVSAKGRVIGSGPYDNYIQTDASINPGNSGGPLFNTQGEVIGINSAIFTGGAGAGNIGIGFAIPINMAKQIVNDLKENGRVTRGYLGVMIQKVTKEIAEPLGMLSPKGALVAEVVKNSPAEKAGIKRGDIIVAINGKTVKSVDELPRLVAKVKPGSKSRVTIFRHGKEIVKTVLIGKLDGEKKLSGAAGGRESDLLGLSVEEVTLDMAQKYGFDTDEGVIVRDIDPEGNAARAGIRLGDIILEMNQKVVDSLETYNKILASISKKKSVLLVIKRRGQVMFIPVPLKK